MNLKYMKVSLFEISYKKKKYFFTIFKFSEMYLYAYNFTFTNMYLFLFNQAS